MDGREEDVFVGGPEIVGDVDRGEASGSRITVEDRVAVVRIDVAAPVPQTPSVVIGCPLARWVGFP